jgi:mannosyltransferase
VSTSEFPAAPGRAPWSSPRVSVRSVPVDVWALLALVALGAAIRILTIDNQSFWTDEALTAYEAHLPFGAMLNTVVHVETTPPLYFVLIWGWAHVFGTTEVALRSISTLAGIATVPIAYLSARELVSRRAGVLAAAFVAVNPFMIWYSQEARAYMLVAALTGASFLFFARARRDPSRHNLGWWAGLSAAAVMTHFFAGFAIAPEALSLLWLCRTRATTIAVGIVAVAQVAMLPFALTDASPSHGAGWIAAIPRLQRVAMTVVEWGASNLYRRTTIPEGLAAGAALVIAVAMLLIFGGDGRTRDGAAVAAAIAACVFAVPLALGLIGQDYFYSRNEIPAFIPLVTVLAAACVAPRARPAGTALAVVLLAVFCFAAGDVQTNPSLQRPDWRTLARALGPALQPRAILAAGGTTADALKIYLPGVTWAQPHAHRVLISELDVIGGTKRARLAATHGRNSPSASRREQAQAKLGELSPDAPIPSSVAPPGTKLIARFRVDNWIVARFALDQPESVSVNSLTRIAPRFFRRTPAALLIFIERPAH